jgi:hypothetical protein
MGRICKPAATLSTSLLRGESNLERVTQSGWTSEGEAPGVLSGCGTNRQLISKVEGSGVTTLFEGFVYLGARARSRGGEPKPAGVAPSVIESNTDYLFNRKADGQAEKVALEVLPTRLRLLGFEVLSGPNADGTGFVFLDNGGPLFLIKARK